MFDIKYKKIILASFAILMFFGLSFSPAKANTIVETAVATPDLSTLVELVTKAGLVEPLQSEGSLTVFAPTNKAFSALPSFVTMAIEKNPENLKNILLYHVVDKQIGSKDVSGIAKVKALNGEYITASSVTGSVFINNAKVIIADVETSNGVVHVVDKVLIPLSVIQEGINILQEQIKGLINTQ